MLSKLEKHSTIVATATGNSAGSALTVIRMSGPKSLSIAESIYQSDRWNRQPNSVNLGHIYDGNQLIDEVMLSYFRAPYTYTGEDMIEISCHASPYIVQQIIQLIVSQGADLASPGEFTMRRFLNGKMDLSQAEAVADLIASENKNTHHIALNQMRGGFTSQISTLRNELIEFAALIELELDFSEEDVEFADRTSLSALLQKISDTIKNLIASFEYGNVIKEGVPVVIVGKPNAGKSSLLNALLNEQKAIVSDIAGTTRDSIEDVIIIDGIRFRFIDTAGLRETNDEIEAQGVLIAKNKVAQAKVMIFLFDSSDTTSDEIYQNIKELAHEDLLIFIIQNKVDLITSDEQKQVSDNVKLSFIDLQYQYYNAISTLDATGIDTLKESLVAQIQALSSNHDTVITNLRHVDALKRSLNAIDDIIQGMQGNLSGDLLSIDIRRALHALGEITGEVEVDRDILGTIFGKFCIGK